MHSPTEEHLEVVYKTLRYLKRTPGKVCYLLEIGKLNEFMDADWAGCVNI